ncbi:MAG TPA: vWA domain-containing protein [Gaiellaceae bacterium]
MLARPRWLARALARSRVAAIPLADLPLFQRAWRRTRLVRLALATALVACVVAAFFVAPAAPGRRFLPANTAGIVVLDVSASIRPMTYTLIERELATLAATSDRFGLVLFSDVAYEALPPGTPAAQLRPLLRFFAPPKQGGFPDNPWEQWFTGGTVISNGLYLAAEMLQRDHVQHGAVVLISDLADDPTDSGRFASAVLLYQQRHIPLEVVGLDPTPDDAEFVKSLLGPRAVTQLAHLPSGAKSRGTISFVGSFPRWLAIAAGVVIVLLALDEWWAEPLRWRPRRAAS